MLFLNLQGLVASVNQKERSVRAGLQQPLQVVSPCVKLAAMQDSLYRKAALSGSAGIPIVSRQQLNAAQYEAVTTIDGPLLVIAGAGSGKTRTLVYRVAHLIEQGVAPESILLLTFTRKSAEEMLWRAGRSCQQVVGGTFHAVANMLLRRYGHYLGFSPNFTIVDRADAEGIINILKSSLSMGGAGKRFPSKRVVINIISRSVNKSVALDDLINEEYEHLAEFLEEMVVLRDHYNSFKFEHGLMDYDDLLVNWQRVLAREPRVRDELAARFRYVMVDEYQDTNSIQAEIIRLLAHRHQNVMVVGDDSQSIYSFRGADFRNIMEFPRLFPGTKIITMEENYRSTQPILDLTNALIAGASEKYSKNLFSRITGREKPFLYEAKDPADEARFVVEKILALQQEGSSLNEIAVLFRSGFHSYKLEIALGSRQLPFEKRGGLKLTESAHIKDVISYFRILVNPGDHLSWNRVLLLLDKIGPKTAQKVLAELKGAAEPLLFLRDYPAPGRLRQGLSALADLLISMKDSAMTPVQQFEFLLEYYLPVFERVYYEDFPHRRKDLEQLKVVLSEYSDLQSFVADTTLDPPEAAASLAAEPGERLVLSTMHSAKGLEWDTVFVINLADGSFPLGHVLPGKQMEEERRLLYVAATRARQRLFFSYPREAAAYGAKGFSAALTPFLAEIDDQLYESRATPAALTRSGPAPGTGYAAGSRGQAAPPAVGCKQPRPPHRALLREGSVVKHPFFGRGRVVKLIGARSVDVHFDAHGKKTLHLDYAKLELSE